MGMPEIFPRAVFSLRPEVRQCAHFISDFQILYPAGSVLILQNFYEKRQKHINLYEKCVYLELIALSFSRKLAAIILNGEKGQIVVYDLQTLKKRKTLNLPADSHTNRFETLSFTHDDQFIIAITASPDWNLVLYNWSKGKITSCTKAVNNIIPSSRLQLYCSPANNAEICIVGQGIFRLLSRIETVWKQYGFQKAEQINITACAWLNKTRILCGTADGKLFLVEESELKAVYSALTVNSISVNEKDESPIMGSSSLSLFKNSSDTQEKEDISVGTIISFSKGFAYSCRPGYVYLFEKKGPNKYKKRNVFKITYADLVHLSQNQLNVIKHLSINVSQDKLLTTTNRAQLYSVRLWGPDITVAPEIPFKILGEPLHHGPINGLTMCMWKPLFATSGQLDRTVRLWNYQTETVQLVKHLSEEVYCLSFHPTGYFIAIGFLDRVEFSTVLLNDIQPYRSLPVRECDVCLFSFSGHYIAVNNQGVIEIFGTVLMNNILSLKGHIGKIKSLSWILEDKGLASCSEGVIFMWDITNGTLIGEIKTPGVSYLDIAVSNDGRNVYAVDSEGCLKLYHNFVLMMDLKFEHFPLEKSLISRSNLMMFMTGAVSGVVSVKMPLSDPPVYSSYQYHASRITQLKLSFDDQTLVTISTAGTVIIWKLNLTEGKAAQIDKNFIYSTEILVDKEELHNKILTIKELSEKLYDLEMSQAKESKDLETLYCEKIQEIHDSHLKSIAELKEKIESTEIDQNNHLVEIRKELKELMEKQAQEKENLIQNYRNKLEVEHKKVSSLESAKNEMIKDFENRIAELQKSKEDETSELIRIHEKKLSEVKNLLLESYEENKKNLVEHEEIKKQIEEDANREIVETKAKYEGLLKEEMDRNVILREEAANMKKSFTEAQQEKDEVKQKLEALQAELHKYQANIHAQEKDVAELKSEIIDRDAAAVEKDEKIFILKKKMLELDKFKFVLKYKMEELKKEIDPKNREIKEQKEQIADMELELENLKKINSSLELQLTELREKIHGTEKQIEDLEKKEESGTRTMKQIRIDIYSLYQDLNDFKKLKDGIKALYHKYRDCHINYHEQFGESDLHRELLMQREFLEKTIKALKSTLDKLKQNKKDTSKVVRDNIVLLEELNSIRKDMKEAVTMVEQMENLAGIKDNKPIIPSEAYSKLEQALNERQSLEQQYQEIINEAVAEAKVLEGTVNTMQSKLGNLIKK